MKHLYYSILGIACIALVACEGGGGGSTSHDDEVTLCTPHAAMDTALDNAAQLWNEGQATVAEGPQPDGPWLDFQSLAHHEVGHIAMHGSGDEHTEDHTAIMHHTMCWNCRKHRLVAADHALINREVARGEMRTIVYLGVQEDTSICDYTAVWVQDDGRIGRVRGSRIEFQRQLCTETGCYPWRFPVD